MITKRFCTDVLSLLRTDLDCVTSMRTYLEEVVGGWVDRAGWLGGRYMYAKN